MRIALLTISDSVAQGKSEDRSGPALRERCVALGWQVVSAHVLPDDPTQIESRLIFLAESGGADVILTAGGTGIGPRDSTPEATLAVCQKTIPGLAELMRDRGRESTRRAALSRAVAGVRGSTIVVNLPGSPSGAVESLDAIADLLPHAAEVLAGARHD